MYFAGQVRLESNDVKKVAAKVEYEQGQFVQDGKIREYFYYLDHQGQVLIRFQFLFFLILVI